MGIQERREREREARRKAVLDAARGLLLERGFVGTTTKQIAESCELSEATLFWYFNSKDEIFTSLLFEGIDFMAAGIDEIRELDAPPKKKLERLWKFFAGVRAEHPEYIHVFNYLAHPQSTASVSDELREEIAKRSGDNFRKFADLLRETIGVRNPRLVADLLWGTFTGLMGLRDSRENLGTKPHPYERELSEAFTLLLSGIAPDQSNGGDQ